MTYKENKMKNKGLVILIAIILLLNGNFSDVLADVTETQKQQDDLNRQALAKKHVLPDTTSWHEIFLHSDNETRIDMAKKHNLPESSTWDQINTHTDNESREYFAEKYGMPSTSTWKEIYQYEEKKYHSE